MNEPSYNLSRRAIPIIVFLISYTITLKTLCPTIYPGDGGELITASFNMGIAHPPGYPLWILLTKFLSLIIPFGSISFRVNLSSAIFLSLANLFIYQLVIKLTKNPIPAVFSSLGFGFSEIVWSQAVSAEVYALNILIISAILYYTFSFTEKEDSNRVSIKRKQFMSGSRTAQGECHSPLQSFADIFVTDQRFLILVIFLSALSITNHHTTFLILPIIWAYILIKKKKELLQKKIMLVSIFLFFLGLTIYVYLPVRASIPGISQWSNPETFDGFMTHITRKVYGTYQQNPYSFKLLGKQITAFITFLLKQGKLITILLFFVGIYCSLKGFFSRKDNYTKTSFIVMLLLIFLSCSIGLNIIINTKVNPIKLFLIEVMYIPSLLVMFIISASTILFFHRISNTKTRRMISSIFLFTTFFLFLTSYHPSDASNNPIAFSYGIDLAVSADPNSTIIAEGDIQLFPLLYLQKVEGFRKDIRLIDRTGSIGKDIYNYRELKYKSPDSLESHKEKKEIELIKESNEGLLSKVLPCSGQTRGSAPTSFVSTALYYTQQKIFTSTEEYKTIPCGLLYMVWVRQASLKETACRALTSCFFYRTWNIDSKKVFLDYFSENILSKLYMSVGETFTVSGESDYAAKYFDYAGQYADIAKEAHNNLAVIYENMGKYPEALEEYKKALTTDPDNDILYFNMGNIYLKTNQIASAEEYYRKSNKLNPGSDIYLFALANANMASNHLDEAEKNLMKLMRLNPDHFDSNILFGDLAKRKKNYSDSENYYKKAISLMPDNPKPYNNLAGLFYQLKRFNEAVTYYEKAYNLDHQYILPLFNLGVIYYKELKDSEKAKFYFQKFLSETSSEALSLKYAEDREKIKKILSTLN